MDVWSVVWLRQNERVIWLALLVSTFFVLATATALRPTRRGPLAMLAFVVGWPAGELATVTALAQAAWLGFMFWWGVPTGWVRVVWFLEIVFVEVGSLVLIASWFAARRATARGMATSGPFHLDPFAVLPDRFTRWWRSLAILPIRSRDVRVIRNIPYGTDRRNRLDLMSTTRSGLRRPVLFYVHGGAWVYGDKREQARPMLFEFARRGWLVVAINYRLSPTNRWPAQIEDTRQALAWVKRTVAAYGGDPERIVVAGGSAGGHLASLLALIGNSDEWRPSNAPDSTDLTVKGCISFYGVLDMTADHATWRSHNRGLKILLEESVMGLSMAEHPAVFEKASPIHRIAPDAPPFLLLQGKSDTLVDYNVARTFASRYRAIVGADAPLWHVELPLTQHAYDLSHSPRTTATTRAAVAFAEWAVAQPSANIPPVPSTLATAYQAPPTDLRIEHEGEWKLPLDVAAEVGPFVVITPFNPLSTLLSNDENVARLTLLEGEAVLHGWSWLRSEGRDPASSEWNESGLALFGLTRNEARALTRRYRQFAFYDVTRDAVNVRSAATGEIVR